MPSRCGVASRVFAALASAATTLPVAAQTPVPQIAGPAMPDPRVRRGFYKDSRGELALARARGDSQVSLVIAARPHATRAVAQAIARFGGTVLQREDDVDYLLVRVPIDRADAVAALPTVQAADVNAGGNHRAYLAAERTAAAQRATGQRAAEQSATNQGSMVRDTITDTSVTAWPPRPSRYPFEHPYSPLADLDATSWRTAHPTWDGRGVTIADIEYTPDMLAPELQTGLTLDGKLVPKYVLITNTVDPDLPGADADSSATLWLRMSDVVTAQDEQFTWRGRTYRAPHAGTFRIDVVNEHYFNISHYLKGDLNRDGNPPGADSLFAVLWDEATNMVWVDTDQQHDFTRVRPMTDYATSADIGVFGHDNPATPERESVGFVLETDRVHHRLALDVGIGSHASLVQGAAAGNRLPHGRFEGVAPGARLASINYGDGSAHALTEALIRAFKDPRIDVVLLEQNVFISDMEYRLHDGRAVSSVITSRLISRYRKPFFVPGGNDPGLAAVGEHAATVGAFGVGAYQGWESYRTNQGILAAVRDNLHLVGSGGPAGDGALKPDILSPSEVLSSDVGYKAGEGMAGLYDLPPGYIIAGGTSTATPVAAASAALLISAAKQAGISYDVDRLRRAIFATARHLDNIPAYEQGNGLIRVGAAWDALTTMAQTTMAQTTMAHVTDGADRGGMAIEVRAPVHTATSAWLTRPNEGPGLYEVDWAAGEAHDRVITLTRTSGPRQPTTLAVSWVGNDGTFASPSSVRLPLGAPVAFPVTVAPAHTGAHSALLELRQPASNGAVRRILCVVIAPDTFAAPSYTLTLRDSLPRPGRRNFFFRVPAGAGALMFDFSDVHGSMHTSLYRPDGRLRTFPFRMDSTGGPRAVARPEPGVWELSLLGDWSAFSRDQHGSAPLAAVPFTLKAAIVGGAVTSDSAAIPATIPLTPTGVAGHNTFAKVTTAITSAALASGYAAHDRLTAQAQRVYTIDVPAGSSALLARVSHASDPRADLDLYLFDCTQQKQPCVPTTSSASAMADEEVAVVHPHAGQWKVVVDAALLPGTDVTYDYLDLVLNPMFGTVGVADAMTERAVDTTWHAQASVWQATSVPAPRAPYAVFGLTNQAVEDADNTAIPSAERLPIAWTPVPVRR